MGMLWMPMPKASRNAAVTDWVATPYTDMPLDDVVDP